MIILRQKEFNSKAQKARRRYMDATIGQDRLKKAGDAEFAFFEGAASYPGENVKKVSREGLNWHYKTNLRPGVSREKAAEVERRAAKMAKIDLDWHNSTRSMIAGRHKQHSTEGYSKDLSKINQRINARSLGDTTLKKDLENLRGSIKLNKAAKTLKKVVK